MRNTKYRPEIDGLRAIAVVVVILFHAGVDSFSGGFVGVDVFFVISGYLITNILLHEADIGRFSVIRFYERRARRILPALFVVLAATTAVAWHVYLPTEFKSFGQGVAAATLFAANIYFFSKQNDYFGLQSEDNPLLHLWSLAVEEQYYLLFPVILLFTLRAGKRFIIPLLSTIFLISLTGAQFESSRNPSAAFYLLQLRAWELLLGSIVAIVLGKTSTLPSYPWREALSILGLTLIAFAVFTFDRTTPFPSLWAMLPTGGTAIIIIFAGKDTVVGRILSAKPAVGIGLISYSLYLS